MIGFFDSGSGGLTVLLALRKKTDADIIYFGDIQNAPYGERSADELEELTKKGFERLSAEGATEFVSACNSVSLSVLQGAVGDARIIEMTRPTARVLRAHAGARTLLLATPATVRSGIYKDAIGVTVELDELPIPELASAIEFGSPSAEIKKIIRNAFEKRKGNQYEGIILGCTHYPFAREEIEEEARRMFGSSFIIDPAEAVAEEVLHRFDVKGTGKTNFILSKDSGIFRARVDELFPRARYTIEVV